MIDPQSPEFIISGCDACSDGGHPPPSPLRSFCSSRPRLPSAHRIEPPVIGAESCRGGMQPDIMPKNRE
jgi:hypothetical protein